ncbi:MAG TPA: DNA recombination protein RmuC [Clostridiales bacterium]|nr:DNA recombination protein RmuC [Clostridiales bacterium]
MEGVIVGLLIVAIVIIVLVSVILVYLLKKQSFSGEGYDASKINEKLDVAVKSLNDIRIETGKMQTEFNVKLEAFEKSNAALREGNTEFIKELKNSTEKELKKSGEILENNLKNIEEQLEKIGERVSNSLKEVREDNTKQLEKIRETVDEKLQKTLDEKLKASFDSVTKHLADVSKKMGEINELTSGVQSLQMTLSGIKTRGNWGEMQLENILKDILAPAQYEFQSTLGVIASSAQQVDAAILMRTKEGYVQYIPIDSKFPTTEFMKMNSVLLEGDKEMYKKLQKNLESKISEQAKTISKYIEPPRTTDFAFMFLPTESLYAEVMKISGLYEKLQAKYKVIVVGPGTLTPMLYGLYQAYKNYQIQLKGQEIQEILVEVAENFNVFEENIKKAIKQAQNLQKTLVKTSKKSEKILNKIELTMIDDENLRKLDSVSDKKAIENDSDEGDDTDD